MIYFEISNFSINKTKMAWVLNFKLLVKKKFPVLLSSHYYPLGALPYQGAFSSWPMIIMFVLCHRLSCKLVLCRLQFWVVVLQSRLYGPEPTSWKPTNHMTNFFRLYSLSGNWDCVKSDIFSSSYSNSSEILQENRVCTFICHGRKEPSLLLNRTWIASFESRRSPDCASWSWLKFLIILK